MTKASPTTTTPAPSRRTLLAGAAAMMATPAAALPINPDAELIAACRAYIVATETYNLDGGRLAYEVCPFWAALRDSQARAEEAPLPTTWAGVRAMAEVCEVMAQPDRAGVLDYSDSYCGDWPGLVVEAVLRLTERSA